MGKKGLSKKGPAATSGPQMSVTIREASTGKKHTNAKSSLKLQHIKNLAVWASRDAAIPSLGAFFGRHLAASSEAFGAPVDPSLFTCQRCESVLHPGHNCTIRIEKNKKNARRKGKKNTPRPQNNIVYTCHFCSHRNMKRGTPKNISQLKVKPHPKSTNQKAGNMVSSSDTSKDNIVANTKVAPLGPTKDEPHRDKMVIVEKDESSKADKMVIVEKDESSKAEDDSVDKNTFACGKTGLLEITDTLEVKNGSDASGPANPLTRPTFTLLDSKMKKKNRSGSKKKVAIESTTPNVEKSSNRKRRKTWTSYKELADDNEKRRKLFS
ncbi:putative ribonuclease P subunit, Rpr2/Snm1/Rpp21 [Helianthus annuus]|nr:putative ribonuclease P subunit, Rpr2/Snm1/Rpp21 [Helianthus annuus]